MQQVGNFIVERTAPRGLAVRISAVHMCKTHWGVRGSHRSRMVTTSWFGELESDEALDSNSSASASRCSRRVEGASVRVWRRVIATGPRDCRVTLRAPRNDDGGWSAVARALTGGVQRLLTG